MGDLSHDLSRNPGSVTDDLLRRLLPELALPGLVPPPDALVDRLARFVAMLDRWSRAYNLTSIRDPGAMVTKHVLDSMSALPEVRGERVLDAGCGAGLPGLPLAMADPDRHYTLLDSGIKKIRFVRQAIAELPVPNARAEHQRLEDHAPMHPYDTITCRAFTSLADFAVAAGRLLAPGGRLLAMKGRRPDEELARMPAGWQAEVVPVVVPGLDAERHLVILAPGTGA